MKYNKASFYIDTFRIHLTIQSFNTTMSEVLRNEVNLAKLSKPTHLKYHVSVRHGQLKKRSSLHMRLECQLPLRSIFTDKKSLTILSSVHG